MHSLLPLSDLTNLPWVAIVAVGGGLLLTIVTIIGGLITAHHKQKLWHDTARLALEKGLPIPPMPGDTAEEGTTASLATNLAGTSAQIRADALQQARAQRLRGYLLGGLINVAVGAGLFFALNQFSRPAAAFAAIPGFIGVALLLAAAIDAALTRPPHA